MGAPVLRDYQEKSIDRVYDAWAAGAKRPVLVAATGAGKTVIFANLIKQWRGSRGAALDGVGGYTYGDRVVVLAHRDELIDQAIKKLRDELPFGVRIGKVKAASNGAGADIVVASVQTLANANRLAGLLRTQARYGRIGLVISDECHFAASPSWSRILDAFTEAGALHLGCTATLARGDGKGLGHIWERVAHTVSTRYLIERGFLAPVEAIQVGLNVDLSDVKIRQGDFQDGDLGRAMMEAEFHRHVTTAYLKHAATRQGIVFTPTIATAEAAAKGLNEAGIPTAVVSGATPRGERQRIYEGYRNGAIQVLANCMVLTVGFDAPWAEVAVMARPTRSQPLFQQIVGRVLRTHPGKEKALVLDIVGSTSDHRLATLIDLTDPTEDRRIPCGLCGAKTCRDCERCMKCGTWCGDCETCKPCQECGGEGCEACTPAGGGPSSPEFTTETVRIDLFDAYRETSAYEWMTTPKGVRFLMTEGGMVFLWKVGANPAGEILYDVGMAVPGKKWERFPEAQGLPLKRAMAAAQKHARTTGRFDPFRKTSNWRRKLPTERQRQDARRLGVDPAPYATAGELSSAISSARGAKMFDPYVRD